MYDKIIQTTTYHHEKKNPLSIECNNQLFKKYNTYNNNKNIDSVN